MILTFIQSEITQVPAVTDDLSLPLCFNTAADSPVIADSSTSATPSRISPSPGIMLPVSTKTISHFFRSVAGISL